MTQTEYENKKAECWEEFKKLDRKSPYSLREANAFTFDTGSLYNKPSDGQLFKDGNVQWSEKAKDTLVTLTFTSLTLTQQEI